MVVFVPYRLGTYFDGGTKSYGSVVYSVIKYHRLRNSDGKTECEVGWGLEIFDHEVYKNTHIIHINENGE